MNEILSTLENQERYALSKRLSFEKNHNRSTAISVKEYQRILKSITFICDHAIDGATLTMRYTSGLKQVKIIIKETKQQVDNYAKQQLPLPNERYRSILHQQIPDFLLSYDVHYHATACHEDLDYPLLYGLPLEHAMYHKQGIDLVAYYVSMFCIEECILQVFQNQLLDFLASYSTFYGIETEDLGVNFCELVLTQAFFTFVLTHRFDLIISYKQKQQIITILKQRASTQYLSRLYDMFLSSFDEDIRQYLSAFETLLINKIKLAIQEDTLEELIVHKIKKKKIDIQIHEFHEPEQFFTLLRHLEEGDTQSRVEAILDAHIGFYDYLDLFEMQILSNDEYFLLFEAFDPMSLAYLFYIHFEEACVFHQRLLLDDALYQKVSITQDWEAVFIQYLIHCDRKQAILKCFTALQEGV